jgi:hypothetical protein
MPADVRFDTLGFILEGDEAGRFVEVKDDIAATGGFLIFTYATRSEARKYSTVGLRTSTAFTPTSRTPAGASTGSEPKGGAATANRSKRHPRLSRSATYLGLG